MTRTPKTFSTSSTSPRPGLHFEDIKKLMNVVHDLIDARNSVIMIEHHLDVIAQADWIIDLGPGGGVNGGNLISCRPPRHPRS